MSHAAPEHRATPARWMVLCDFDGTVCPTDVTDSLLERFGRDGWQALEQQWKEGRIGARACMAGQVALLDCSREELDAHLATIAVDPDFATFVAAVRAAGASIAIASDGLDGAILSILARTSMPEVPVYASRLVQTGPRRWTLEFPHARADCVSGGATCKCVHARACAGSPVLTVGDGASDFCVAAASDLTFARARLLAHCIDEGIAHRPIADFGAATVAWRELTAPLRRHRSLTLEEELVDDRE